MRRPKGCELGGSIFHGPQDVPGVGRFYIIPDPAGAVITVIMML
jgi:predicted enzyme related to lactoylglutathione lyase